MFVAAAIAMWLGVKREDLIKPGGPSKGLDPDDPEVRRVAQAALRAARSDVGDL